MICDPNDLDVEIYNDAVVEGYHKNYPVTSLMFWHLDDRDGGYIEIGYNTRFEFRKQGFCTRLVKTVVEDPDYFCPLPDLKIFAVIRTRNLASISVAKNAGLVLRDVEFPSTKDRWGRYDRLVFAQQ